MTIISQKYTLFLDNSCSNKDLHKILMKTLDTNGLNKNKPRTDANLLFKVDNIEKTIDNYYKYDMTVQHNEKYNINPFKLQDKLFVPISPVTEVKIREYDFVKNNKLITDISDNEAITRANIYGYVSAIQSHNKRKKAIPKKFLNDKMLNKIENLNLDVLEIQCISKPPHLINGKGNFANMIPSCELHATVLGTLENVEKLLHNGFGRGKNYGLGLIQIEE